MVYNFAAVKAKMRRDVHTSLSIDAKLESIAFDAPVDLKVRWHVRQVLTGDLQEAAYAEVIEGIERIIFDKEELSAKGVSLNIGDRVTIVFDPLTTIKLILQVEEPDTGPVERIWKVTR